ncbi:MAG TPA: DUF6351 family protein, partial [Nocardioidaceae bacterium]|nr:DUF6351 family protein [Nocardioidaceae bacterium]
RRLVVEVLSNRADLVSGGDVLVSVPLPEQVDARRVRVLLGDRDVTEQFAVRPNGAFQGLLEGLAVGENVVRVQAPGYDGRRVIVNHPNGGPVFSGPQHEPYQCQATALDDQCNEPASYSLLYKSTDPMQPGLQPYDPENPPSDVATTTTDEGVTVPFIVRREDGYQARDRYSILTLFQPGEAWEPWAPQEQWNHKVLATHGGGCGASYAPGSPRLDDYSGTIPAFPGIENSYVTALGKGFAVMSTALNNTGHNCSLPRQAESMVMAKERLVEQYGPVRYTIGTGCSGGSIAQHTIANAYPGVYQGLVTTCSYPDVLTAGAQFADYHLLRLYFEDPSRWADGVVWSPTQMAEVEGHLTHVNAVTADEGLFKDAINPENDCSGTKDPVPGDASTRFDSETNPAGVRCSILDMMVNALGPRPESVWSTQEQAAGHGFAGIPFANTGVQYGLGALEKGLITPAQFVDLNVKVGGLDINADPVETRIEGDPGAIANVYRTGLVNETNHLDEVAMINHGGPDPGIAHDYAHAFWTEERLQRDQGHTDNRVMWFGEAPLIGDVRWATEAFLAMDRWLAAVEADGRDVPLSSKIVEDKPADITDRCENVPGVDMLTLPGGEVVCQQPTLQTRLSTPREVAGDDTANDRVACQLRPLDRADYDVIPVPFSDEQWATLQSVFPDGVCDWSKPGQGQGPGETWLSYADESGAVVYGGRNLPPAPAASGTGWASTSFGELLEQ